MKLKKVQKPVREAKRMLKKVIFLIAEVEWGNFGAFGINSTRQRIEEYRMKKLILKALTPCIKGLRIRKIQIKQVWLKLKK